MVTPIQNVHYSWFSLTKIWEAVFSSLRHSCLWFAKPYLVFYINLCLQDFHIWIFPVFSFHIDSWFLLVSHLPSLHYDKMQTSVKMYFLVTAIGNLDLLWLIWNYLLSISGNSAYPSWSWPNSSRYEKITVIICWQVAPGLSGTDVLGETHSLDRNGNAEYPLKLMLSYTFLCLHTYLETFEKWHCSFFYGIPDIYNGWMKECCRGMVFPCIQCHIAT